MALPVARGLSATLEETDSVASELPVAPLVGCAGGGATAAPPVALRLVEEGRAAFAMPLTCVRRPLCR